MIYKISAISVYFLLFRKPIFFDPNKKSSLSDAILVKINLCQKDGFSAPQTNILGVFASKKKLALVFNPLRSELDICQAQICKSGKYVWDNFGPETRLGDVLVCPDSQYSKLSIEFAKELSRDAIILPSKFHKNSEKSENTIKIPKNDKIENKSEKSTKNQK